MYLFTRKGRVRPGNTRGAMTWALEITEKVNQITGLDVELWTTQLSPANGTLVWSTVVEDLTQLDDANAKLMVDNLFVDLVDQGATFGGDAGVDDEIAQVIHTAGDAAARPDWVAVVRSQFAPGCIASGVEIGVQIAELATKIGGAPTTFLMSTTGQYGAVTWITGTPTLAELQRGEESVNADPGFIALIDEHASKVFVPAATTQAIFSRLA